MVQNLLRLGIWKCFAYIIVGVCIWDGGGYAFGGNSLGQGPSLEVMRNIPGGMRTHGWVMLILAAVLIVICRHESVKWARKVMGFIIIYSLFVSISLIWSWTLNSQVTWSAPSKWFMVGAIAFILRVFARQISDRSEG